VLVDEYLPTPKLGDFHQHAIKTLVDGDSHDDAPVQEHQRKLLLALDSLRHKPLGERRVVPRAGLGFQLLILGRPVGLDVLPKKPLVLSQADREGIELLDLQRLFDSMGFHLEFVDPELAHQTADDSPFCAESQGFLASSFGYVPVVFVPRPLPRFPEEVASPAIGLGQLLLIVGRLVFQLLLFYNIILTNGLLPRFNPVTPIRLGMRIPGYFAG